MTDRFRNKYRIQSNRMPCWDYSGNGFYFITLVTRNRERCLGEIIDGKMILSEIGNIVETELLKSFKIRKELLLDEYIIMPNHLHAIIIIDKPYYTEMSDDTPVETHDRASLQAHNH